MRWRSGQVLRAIENIYWIAATRVLKDDWRLQHCISRQGQGSAARFCGRVMSKRLGFSPLDDRLCFLSHGNVVSWKWKRQPTVATSSIEAEYMALYAAAQEAVWLRLLLSDIGFELGAATTIYEGNQGCIALAKNPVYHSRTKHIEIKFYFLL